MKSDKELKKEFKIIASKDPEKYYAVNALKNNGFLRQQCSNCNKYFWSTDKRDVCGDAECMKKVTLFEKNPSRKRMSYIDVWNKYKEHFHKLGYSVINRYPVVAKWNPTTDFTIASIAAFQPYVISGEVEAPAKKLVIPQFCLRFGDIDNVGITGSHLTGFVMIGQHAFVKPEEWNQEKFFMDIYSYVTGVVGLSKDELILHEDAWAGAANYGPCMEFFSNGIELFNQVYMMFEHRDEGDRELKIKVLDMGLGMERIAWFSQGTATSYDAVFPTVLEYLIETTKVDYDQELFRSVAPYASLLNLDESTDINKAWKSIADNLSLSVEELKSKILPMTAIYSIAEHSRALLLAITDGALPSNVGGFYNLRVIFRRMMSFIDKFKWEIDMKKLLRIHAIFLEPIFPELQESVNEVNEILEYEKKKYYENKQRTKAIIENIISKKQSLDVNKLIELYDSNGIDPEELAKEAEWTGMKIIVPENFYALVTEKHVNKENITQTKKEKHYDVDEFHTEALYFEHFDLVDFKANVLRIIHDIEENNYKIILDKTAFYPTSGGQLHDIGSLNKCKVLDVFKQGSVIIHVLEEVDFKEHQTIHGRIDFDRRIQLAQHHTGTHILNGACRKILGNHIWQAGASKTLEKARLDITHYENLTEEQIQDIEKLANRIIKENLPVYKSFMKRNVAEAKYGFRLYQGGAVPGKDLRVVEILGFDVEACGGTHLDITGDVGQIKILKTSKIQDGVVRIEFTAGTAAEKTKIDAGNSLNEIAKILNCEINQIPARTEELFEKWKKIVKKNSQEPFKLESTESTDEGNDKILIRTASILKTQPENIIKTIERFLREIYEKTK
ncbi:TPA: alanine--tRNA ligase [Candidatus Woesearchaeota archaeon]|nr:alanine--tRNA ligase [Candidatus Woesearchaeota archaeon]HIH31718.1 alanine--tRNA ligase [Candidatus Woesearchaeota archaeon]HIH55022.1 alanine--tRNA ligase [Candidatus Woesearchaeota archaeon]HIJ01030.1 alanine--tRNA ligase [Candidatus Woesearchaeota archaeon]HIJ14746.1 alanine--tRNA ligase [Candidatus Woesearchaeota archaeon]